MTAKLLRLTSEDCLENECHQTSGLSLTLQSVNDTHDVQVGQTTLFHAEGDGFGDTFTAGGMDRLTYLLQTIGGTHPGDARCYVWGHDVSYYAVAGCTVF